MLFNNRKIKYIILFIVVRCPWVGAAFDQFPSSPTNVAAGRLRLNGTGNLIDSFTDPASLAQTNRFAVAVTWGRQFQLKDLKHTSWVIGIPVKRGGIAIGGSTFGNPLYQESIVAVMIGKAVFDKLELGLNVIHYRLQIKNYGQASSTGLSLSWRFHLSPDLVWATSIRNLNTPVIGQAEEKLPQVVATGVLAEFQDRIRIQGEWEHDIEFEGRMKFGLIYLLKQWVGFACGYTSSPGQFTAGVLVKTKRVSIEYAAVTHQQINRLSQQLGLGIALDRP